MQLLDRAAYGLPRGALHEILPFASRHRSFFGHKRVFEFQMIV